ncbi:MAG: hypothetical protein ACI90V_008300 [Bacillariaceae sp.]|jgi:hypothetical protein
MVRAILLLLLQPSIALHCNYSIWVAIFRMAWASCGRERLARLQLPVLVKYRIALLGVPVASDSRILSLPSDLDYDDPNAITMMQLNLLDDVHMLLSRFDYDYHPKE